MTDGGHPPAGVRADRPQPRVIVTRPAREAAQWVAALAGHGLVAQALPLIEIAPLAAPPAVQAASDGPADGLEAVMFVSGNAVEHFYQSNRPFVQYWRDLIAIKTRAWATGPGTVQALLDNGVKPDRIDAPEAGAAQFDSETLWQKVRTRVQPGWQVLIVRGADASGQVRGRDWLAAQLRTTGAVVHTVPVYVRRCPDWDAATRAAAHQAAGAGAIWLLSSSEAIDNLQRLLPGADWAQARAVATHPRIAQRARAAGFGVVWESRPSMEAVVASIESVQ